MCVHSHNMTKGTRIIWFRPDSSSIPIHHQPCHSRGFAFTVQTIAFEFNYFGINIKDMLMKQNKPLVYSEQGLGGMYKNKVAPTLEKMATFPFSGVWPNGGYQTSCECHACTKTPSYHVPVVDEADR